ncbi:hypothetical protein MYSE111917_24070 [Mycobacterium senriense]
MEHRAQRILLGHLRQQRRDGVPVADIAGRHGHRCTLFAQFGGQLGHAVGAFTGATDQQHVPHPVPLDKMPRHRRTRHAGAAGDQRGAAGQAGRPVRHGEHDLADVAGLADKPVRVAGAARVECLDRQRRQDPAREKLHQLRQHLGDAVRAGLHEIERAIRHPGMGRADVIRVTQIGLAHFNEAAAGPQQPQRRVVELPRQGIEHHVHAAGKFPLELQGAGIRDVCLVESHGAQGVPLAAAGGREHLRAPMPGQLHRGHAHTAGGGVHQYPLPGAQTGQHRQPVIGRQEHHRHGRGLRHRPAPRHPGHQPAIDGGLRAGEPEDPHHRIPDGDIRHAGAELGDDSRALGAQLRGTGVHAQRHQHIAEVHPGGGDGHPHLTGLQCRRRVLLHRQVLKRPGIAGGQPPHRRRIGQPQQRSLVGRLQPGAVGHTVAHHQLRLAATDHRCGIERSVGIDQHHAAGVLGLRRTCQPPHRGTGQVRDALARQPHRPAGQHRQDPGRLTRQPGLQHTQRLMRRPVDGGHRTRVGGR